MILNISCICCPLNSVIRCCITWISCSITGTKMVWYWLLQFLWLVSNRKIYTHFVFQWCNVAHGIRHTLTSVFFWTTTPKNALDHEHVWHQALIVTKVCWPFLSPPSLVFVWAFAILGSYEAEEKFGKFHLRSWELLSAFHLGYEAPPAYAATLLPLDLQWHLMSQIGLMKDTDRSCETSLRDWLSQCDHFDLTITPTFQVCH